MSNLFNAENKFFTAVNTMADAVILNILWLIGCIPLITIGTSTCAMYYTYHKVIRCKRSSVWREFWHAYKTNFKQATKLWLVFVVIFTILIGDLKLCEQFLLEEQAMGYMAYLFIRMLALAVIWFDYAIAYNARIADNFKTTMKNSAAIAFANVGRSLLVLLFTAIAAYLLWLNPIYCWFLPIIAVALINGQIERVLRKYMSEEDLEMEVEYDKSMND